jgi:hypothetical protein
MTVPFKVSTEDKLSYNLMNDNIKYSFIYTIYFIIISLTNTDGSSHYFQTLFSINIAIYLYWTVISKKLKYI